MGGFLNRSADTHEEHLTKKDKRKKRNRKLDGEAYFVHENENLNGDLNYTYDLWKKELEQQQQMFAMNGTDPPGAPCTYSSNDLMIQSWSAQQNLNNSFYPMNSSYNFSYPVNQYNPTAILPMTVPEIRTSKKVQFSTTQQAEPSLSKSKSNDQSLSLSTRPKKLITKTSSVPTSIEKPIYVGIDYQATLAERSQTNVIKHHRKTSSQQTHRTRSHRNQLLTDSPQSNGSQTIGNNSFQRKSSPIIPSRTHSEQAQVISNESKPIKPPPRTHHRPHRTSSPINHKKKPKKSCVNHDIHQSQLSNSSPTARRRIEMKQTSSPVMRISLSQLNQQHAKPVMTRVRV